MVILLPYKPFDAQKLRDEIAAAGVGIGTISPLGVSPFRVNNGVLGITVVDGSSDAVVQQVYAAHRSGAEKTPEQVEKDRLLRSLTATDTDARRIRAVAMALYRAHVEMRVAFNGLLDSLAGIGVPLPPKMRIRTWEEAERDLILEVQNSEVQP